jgi:uncharacterized protein
VKQLKRIILCILFVVIVGMGASFTLKVAIGLGAWDAVAQSVSHLSGIKVGTLGMILNITCVVGQLILLRKNFKLKHLLQVPVAITLGLVVNFFLYDVLGAITIDGYIMKLVVLLAAFVVVAFAVSVVMVLDVVTFPLEGFCMALANKTKWKFPVIRQAVDIISLLVALLLTFGLSLPMTLREGTVIGMLLFGPMLGFFMKRIEPVFRKLDLLNEEKVEKIEVDKNSLRAG